MQVRSEAHHDLETIANLIKTNKAEELRKLLDEARLTEESPWFYRASSEIIKNATRDAMLAGHEEIVKLLMDAGISPDAGAYIEDGENRRWHTFMHYAVKSGKLSMVKLLVENGAKIYTHEPDNRHENEGIRTAIIEGHKDIVDYLLECGAEPNALCKGDIVGVFDKGITFLARAALDGNLPIVESLVKHGASVPLALRLAYKEMYVDQYKEYLSAIRYVDNEEKSICYNKKQMKLEMLMLAL